MIVDPDICNTLPPSGYIGKFSLKGSLFGLGRQRRETDCRVLPINSTWLTDRAPDQSGRQGRLYKAGVLVRYSWRFDLYR